MSAFRLESTPRTSAALVLSLADPGRAVALRDYLLRLGASAEIRPDLTICTVWDEEDDLTDFVVSWEEKNGVGVEIRPVYTASSGPIARVGSACREITQSL